MLKIKLVSFFMLSLFSFASIASEQPATQPKPLSIMRITPEGMDIAQTNQIVIEFNRPVVPFGKMDRKPEEIPVTITPALNCQWRWLTRSALECLLDDKDKLKPATRYHITVNPGIKAEDGAVIVKPYAHEFVTIRPHIRDVEVFYWLDTGKPIVNVSFNQRIATETMLKNAYFVVDGEEKRSIPVKLVENELLKNLPHGENAVAMQKNSKGMTWFLMPAENLPLDKDIELKIAPELISLEGSEPSGREEAVIKLHTFPEFMLLGLHCYDNKDQEIFIKPEELQTHNADKRCNPLNMVSLQFSAPVSRAELMQHIQVRPAAKNSYFMSKEEIDAESERLESLQSEAGRVYSLNLWPRDGLLKANQEYTVNISGMSEENWWNRFKHWLGKGKLKVTQDRFGRVLAQSAQIKFTTDHRKPNYELPYRDAVLEQSVDSDVPFYVTNIENVKLNYNLLNQQGIKTGLQYEIKVPKVADLQFAIPLEIRKLLDNQSGVVDIHLSTTPTVFAEPAKLMAQVTPYQVEAKIGHFSSLIWVTDLATGQPVTNAKVTLYRAEQGVLAAPANILATGMTDSKGLLMLPGTSQLESLRNYEHAQWYLLVEKGATMAWLPLDYTYKIEIYRFGDIYSWQREKYDHIIAWGTTAQGIYRPGDTIQYKIYVCNQNDRTLVPAPAQPYQLTVTDPTGKVMQDIKSIKLDEFGTLQGELPIPKEAAAGWYQFELKADFPDDAAAQKQQEGDEANTMAQHQWQVLRVLVSDFTPAAFKVTNQLNGSHFIAGQEVNVNTQAKLHAGGAYGNANLRLTATLLRQQFTSKHPVAANFWFASYNGNLDSYDIYQKLTKLNANGEADLKFIIPPQPLIYGKLQVESAVQDERGKYITALSQADYIGVDRLVGLRTQQWIYEANKPAKIDYLVVDDKGNPIAGTPVNMVIEREVTQAARVKSAGNAYLTHYTTTWQKEAECKGTSTLEPLTCEFKPPQAGNYRLTAKIQDTKGQVYTNQTWLWVTGSNFVVWNQESDAVLEIIPEKKSYQVGETAKFLVKNPYPGAKALITVERYGVIDHWIQELKDSTPVIEVPVKPDYLPGFYLSVSIFSPRVEKPDQPGQVDLGKPAMRMGYQKILVDDPYKQLTITAKADKEIYKPREQVTVQLHAQPRVAAQQGKKQPIQFALAVVDEAVLDLLANSKENYDVYHGLYHLDDLDLENYSLINRLVGRQKFEKKGANPGGDGGSDFAMRSLFKFVTYWNPAVTADSKGNASVTFSVPDNLTKWRVIALAATPQDQVGTGYTNFIVNRPTEIRPVMPNQVTGGDRFLAGFSIMNRMDQVRTLQVNVEASGVIDSAKTPAHYQTTLTLQPYQRQVVYMPIQTKVLDNLTPDDHAQVQFKVRVGDQLDQDALQQEVPVNPLQVPEVTASYGTSDKNQVQEKVVIPQEAHSNIGKLQLMLSPSVIGNLEGAFRYAKFYPYKCWEQRLTKALLAAEYKALHSYLAPELTWTAAADLPANVLAEASSFQAPNGGMAYFTAEDNYADPYLSAYTALGFTWLKQAGYVVPETVENNLHQYLKNYLRENSSPDFYTNSMTATVRAVILAALAEQKQIEAADLERLRSYLPQMSLLGQAYYLKAALQVPESQKLAQTIWQQIMGHANQTPGKLSFTENLDKSYERILTSNLRDNCAVLDALLSYQEKATDAKQQNDLAYKMVRAITQARGAKDHWENTQENIFCANALIHYSQTHESTTPAMRLQVQANTEKWGEAKFSSVRDPAAVLTHPLQKEQPGQKVDISINREGVGRYYYSTRLEYFPKILASTDTNAGIELHREYSVERDGKWVLLKDLNNKIKRGELVRVDLYLNLPAARNFVVVDDPVPGGLEPVNPELATSSQVDAAKAEGKRAGNSFWFKYNDWLGYGYSRWSFYHQEFRHNAVRFYSDYLPPGRYHLSYTAQAISEGEFAVMSGLAQEMYDSEVFGKAAGGQLGITS